MKINAAMQRLVLRLSFDSGDVTTHGRRASVKILDVGVLEYGPDYVFDRSLAHKLPTDRDAVTGVTPQG